METKDDAILTWQLLKRCKSYAFGMNGSRGRFHRKSDIPTSVSSKLPDVKWDHNTNQDKLDEFIVTFFPTFIILCIAILILFLFILEANTLADILYAVCLAFTLGFSLLGAITIMLRDTGVKHSLRNTVAIFCITAVAGVLVIFTGTDSYVSVYLLSFFDLLFGNAPVAVSIFISVFTLLLMIIFTCSGVISVIVGYFRSYLYRILRFIEKSKDSDSRRKRIVYWFFEIPDIIDVESVELDPEQDEGRFNTHLMLSVFFSLFMLGITVCSYIFLNPFFLKQIPFEEMITISMMLSMFFAVLVLPWSIIKSIGAHVNSSAARPYYLWIGLRGRLYQGFFAIAFIMMMMTLSAYLGMDFSRILLTYLSYVVIMAVISFVTSYIYVNYFYIGFKNGIIKSFYQGKYSKPHDDG